MFCITIHNTYCVYTIQVLCRLNSRYIQNNFDETQNTYYRNTLLEKAYTVYDIFGITIMSVNCTHNQ